MPVSQKDIARQLRLSTATVSRSLMADPMISPRTAARVAQAAAEMGYRPGRRKDRTVGRARGRQTATRVGVLLRTGQDSEYQDQRVSLLEGMTVAARQAGVQLQIDTLLPGDEKLLLTEPHRVPMLTGPEAPDGLILWQGLHHDALQRVVSFRPCVMVNNHYLPGSRVDAVGPNHFDAIVGLVEHLYAQGHRRIGYFGPPHQFVWGPARASAFVAGLLKLQLPEDPAWRIDSDSPAADARLVDHSREDVTAWVVPHEHLAHRAWGVLTQAGLQVPEAVSLAGFHVHAVPPGVPPITTALAPWRDIGRHALRRLLDRLAHPEEPGRRVMLDCQLRPGHTSAGPRAERSAS